MGLRRRFWQAVDLYVYLYDYPPHPRKTPQQRRNFPKCPFCGKRDYTTGPQMLTNSRVMMQYVRAIATCNNCGMQFQATRESTSKKWRFDIST